MIEQVNSLMDVAQSTWQGGMGGKILVVTAIYLAFIVLCICAMVLTHWFWEIDRKFARKQKIPGTVMKKYLEVYGKDVRFEVEDSLETRKRTGVRFKIRVWCADGIEFDQGVYEDLFDVLSVGDQLPVSCGAGLITGRVRLISMPTTAWEWQHEIDKAVAIGQLAKQW